MTIKYKKIIFLSILITSLITIISYWFFSHFMNTNDIILKKDLTCLFRENIKIGDFILKLDGDLLDNYYIDTTYVGKKKVNIQYRNHYGLIVTKKIEIEIIDNIPPTIVVNNPYTIEKGKLDNLEESIFCADNYDDNVSCKISGTYNLNKSGEYNLKMTAADFSGNITEKNFTLKVVDKIVPPKNTKEEYTSFKSIYQNYKTNKTRIGLDLSKWQQEVDFTKLKEQGVTFVMLKIGGQPDINEDITIDPKFYENIEKAKKNNIDVGIYFYSYAKSEKEAIKQAKWVIKILRTTPIQLPIAFDWENWSDYNKFNMSFHTLNKVAQAFIGEVEKYGYKGILYSSKYYLENIWYKEEYTTWLAHYTTHSDYDKDYLLWQICSDGKIDGIEGYVDIDIMYLNQ